MRRCMSFRKLGALAWAGWVLLLSACSRTDTRPSDSNQLASGESAPDRGAAPTAEFAASLPRVGGPAGYVGSQTCRDCHQDQYASWHRSYHRTMTQIAVPDTVRADFHNVVLTNDGVRFVLSQRGDEFWARMERLPPVAAGEDPRNQIAPGSAEPPPHPSLSPGGREGAQRAAGEEVHGRVPPEALDVRIGLVTGSHHMQVFWVPEGTGNLQIGFPFTWLIPEQRWVPRNSTFVRPPEIEHRSEMWNVVCSRCHATGVEPRVDRKTRTVDTRAGELGIACEACHGPGQRHVEARLAAEKKGATRPDAQTLRQEIIHPKKIDPVRTSQICGFCHSMKWFDRSEEWPRQGFSYRPGDDLEQTTPIIRPSRVGAIPGLADYLARNPNLLRDFFWPDGMVRVSGRDYNGLLESPCYKGGRFSCLSCHSLHESDPDDQLSARGKNNLACAQCHERFRDEWAVATHTHHQAASSGSQCYNCHMPFTTYGVLKAIRSHQISSPKVADELATGRPNACNLCHLDKPLAWTANHLERWYGQSVQDLSTNETAISDGVRLALAGDAGQRVLIGWHLGWEPALKVSGKSWVPPVLAQLLDDPYAAVRCVAERSLRQVAPNLVPSHYDFTVPPDSRAPVHGTALEHWSREVSGSRDKSWPAQTLVDGSDPASTQAAFQRLMRQRDERPVRLRE